MNKEKVSDKDKVELYEQKMKRMFLELKKIQRVLKELLDER